MYLTLKYKTDVIREHTESAPFIQIYNKKSYTIFLFVPIQRRKLIKPGRDALHITPPSNKNEDG